MDTFTFESIEEFCEMLEDVLTDSTETISVVAKYNDAKEIIKELVLYGYDFGYIHLDYEYPNEYEVTDYQSVYKTFTNQFIICRIVATLNWQLAKNMVKAFSEAYDKGIIYLIPLTISAYLSSI